MLVVSVWTHPAEFSPFWLSYNKQGWESLCGVGYFSRRSRPDRCSKCDCYTGQPSHVFRLTQRGGLKSKQFKLGHVLAKYGAVVLLNQKVLKSCLKIHLLLMARFTASVWSEEVISPPFCLHFPQSISQVSVRRGLYLGLHGDEGLAHVGCLAWTWLCKRSLHIECGNGHRAQSLLKLLKLFHNEC